MPLDDITNTVDVLIPLPNMTATPNETVWLMRPVAVTVVSAPPIVRQQRFVILAFEPDEE